MTGFLDKFRKKIVGTVWKDCVPDQSHLEIDDKIALGVLLWEVAQVDEQFLPAEEAAILQILKDFGHVQENDLEIVMESIKAASADKIDLFTFTRELSEGLPYERKQPLIEQLFRVAYADGRLDHDEHEMIRKLAGLILIDHKDFIAAKEQVELELNMS